MSENFKKSGEVSKISTNPGFLKVMGMTRLTFCFRVLCNLLSLHRNMLWSNYLFRVWFQEANTSLISSISEAKLFSVCLVCMRKPQEARCKWNYARREAWRLNCLILLFGFLVLKHSMQWWFLHEWGPGRATPPADPAHNQSHAQERKKNQLIISLLQNIKSKTRNLKNT